MSQGGVGVREERQRRPGARLGVLLVVVAGAALRAFRLSWGLPGYSFPDAMIHFIRPAAKAVAGPLEPSTFVHPPVLVLLLTGVFRLWSAVTGELIHPVGPGFAAVAPSLIMAGRLLTLALSTLSIILVYLVGRRLIGERGGVLAAAAFALSPLHILESHRVATDIPMIFLLLGATHLAVRARTTERARLVLGSFLLSGLAAATKYTGIFAAPIPGWIVLRAPLAGRLGSARMRLLTAGAMLTVGAFALGCIPCFLEPRKFVDAFRLMGGAAYLLGMPGVDLASGWTQHRYVYPLLVALPYMMGWPVYLAALAGVAVLYRQDRKTAALLLVATVPYFLFMGGAVSAVPRYYLQLSPFFAIAAGAALSRVCQVGERRRLGAVVAVIVLAYTALLGASQVRRLGLGPQRAVGGLVTALEAEMRDRTAGRLVVGYPNRIALQYDAVAGFLRRPGIQIVELPSPYRHPGQDPAEVPDSVTTVARDLAWLEAAGIDVIVLPSWIEHAVRRERPHGQTARFFGQLADGTLGFRLAGTFRNGYLTEGLYTWADPMLDTHWETAIAGYKVFVRAALRAN